MNLGRRLFTKPDSYQETHEFGAQLFTCLNNIGLYIKYRYII